MTSEQMMIQWAAESGFRILANTDREIECVALLGAGGRTVELTVRRGALGAWSTDLYDAEFEGGGRFSRCFAGDARLVWDYALETLRGAR